MDNPTRKFHLGDVLSITTGFLVSPRHMDGIYDILNYMTGASLFTHQLPRAADECRPYLFAQYPALESVEVPKDRTGNEWVESWLAAEIAVLGETLEISPIILSPTNYNDPLGDLVKMGAKNVIPVIIE